jgi:hypothetical protein
MASTRALSAGVPGALATAATGGGRAAAAAAAAAPPARRALASLRGPLLLPALPAAFRGASASSLRGSPRRGAAARPAAVAAPEAAPRARYAAPKAAHGFTLVEEQYIEEYDSLALLYRHDKTGAQLMSLVNDDENKTFGATLRTPVADSKGTPHILEHSVLCGSRKYPIKEPFVELMKVRLLCFIVWVLRLERAQRARSARVLKPAKLAP